MKKKYLIKTYFNQSQKTISPSSHSSIISFSRKIFRKKGKTFSDSKIYIYIFSLLHFLINFIKIMDSAHLVSSHLVGYRPPTAHNYYKNYSEKWIIKSISKDFWFSIWARQGWSGVFRLRNLSLVARRSEFLTKNACCSLQTISTDFHILIECQKSCFLLLISPSSRCIDFQNVGLSFLGDEVGGRRRVEGVLLIL